MLFLLPFQSGTRNCLHLDLLTYSFVYMMFLKFVLKLLLILQYNCYSIELSIEFFLSNFILKKINVKTNDQCSFCINGVETIQHIFVCVKILYLFGGISACIYKDKPKKGLVLMLLIVS